MTMMSATVSHGTMSALLCSAGYPIEGTKPESTGWVSVVGCGCCREVWTGLRCGVFRPRGLSLEGL